MSRKLKRIPSTEAVPLWNEMHPDGVERWSQAECPEVVKLKRPALHRGHPHHNVAVFCNGNMLLVEDAHIEEFLKEARKGPGKHDEPEKCGRCGYVMSGRTLQDLSTPAEYDFEPGDLLGPGIIEEVIRPSGGTAFRLTHKGIFIRARLKSHVESCDECRAAETGYPKRWEPCEVAGRMMLAEAGREFDELHGEGG